MSFKIVLIRGETLATALEVMEGDEDIFGAAAISHLKRATPDNKPPPDTAPVLLTPLLKWRDPLGEGLRPGWVLEADTSSLSVGMYIVDVRIQLDDGYVDYSDPLLVEIKPRVTAT